MNNMKWMRRAVEEPVAVLLLIVGLVAVATAVIAATFDGLAAGVREHAGEAAAIGLGTLALQLVGVRLPLGRGSLSFASFGLVAAGIAISPGYAALLGVACGLAQWARSRGLLHRALFDVGNFAVAAAAAAGAYAGMTGPASPATAELAAGCVAAAVYIALNFGLLCCVMSLSESRSIPDVWRQRFDWLRLEYVLAVPAIAAAVVSYQDAAQGTAALLVLPALFTARLRRARGRL